MDDDDNDEFGETVHTPKRHGTANPLRLLRHLCVVVIGDGTFITHPLSEAAPVSIGRSNTCEISINDQSLSRRHAVLTVTDHVTIEDLD